MSLILSICALIIGILTNSVNGVPQYSREYLSPVIEATGGSNWYTANRKTGTISEKSNKDSFTFIDSSEVHDVNPPIPVAHRTPQQQRVSFQKNEDINANSSRQTTMKDGRRMRNASRSRSLYSRTGDFNVDFAVHSHNGTLKVVYPTRHPNNNYDIITQGNRVRLPDNDGDDEEELTTSRRESDIVFPNDTDTNYHDMPTSAYQVTKCKSDDFLCSDIDNYPEEQINNVVKEEAHRFRDFFGVDKLTQANITSRIGAPGDSFLCDSAEDLIFPTKGLTSQDKWKFIVNTANFTQGIRVEKCTRQKSRCNFADSFPNGYEPICEQKFISRQLVSFSSERGKTATDQFKIPSCCNCVLKRAKLKSDDD